MITMWIGAAICCSSSLSLPAGGMGAGIETDTFPLDRTVTTQLTQATPELAPGPAECLVCNPLGAQQIEIIGATKLPGEREAHPSNGPRHPDKTTTRTEETACWFHR